MIALLFLTVNVFRRCCQNVITPLHSRLKPKGQSNIDFHSTTEVLLNTHRFPHTGMDPSNSKFESLVIQERKLAVMLFFCSVKKQYNIE
jgi:hypothetical protein